MQLLLLFLADYSFTMPLLTSLMQFCRHKKIFENDQKICRDSGNREEYDNSLADLRPVLCMEGLLMKKLDKSK